MTDPHTGAEREAARQRYDPITRANQPARQRRRTGYRHHRRRHQDARELVDPDRRSEIAAMGGAARAALYRGGEPGDLRAAFRRIQAALQSDAQKPHSGPAARPKAAKSTPPAPPSGPERRGSRPSSPAARPSRAKSSDAQKPQTAAARKAAAAARAAASRPARRAAQRAREAAARRKP